MYSVLMVDDEEEVLAVIRKKLDWEELGFTVVGTAANGVEALDFVTKNTPDVVLTDIRMPYMDGLELSRRIHELYPDICIIIFSGFDDFELAKKAIALGVKDYLLKPIDTEELKTLFEKTKENLDEEREKRNSIERLERYYTDSLPALKESFLIALVEGEAREENIPRYLKEYDIRLTGPYYLVSVIHVSLPEKEDVDGRLLAVSIRKLVEERLTHEGRHLVFSYRDDIVSIVQLDSMDDVAGYTDECDRFSMQVKYMKDAVITIGIGRAVDSIHSISNSYKGAREALTSRVIYGRGTAINIAEIEPEDNFDDARAIEKFKRILRQIKVGGPDDLKQAVDDYITALVECRPDPGRFRILMMELLTGFYRFLGHNEIDRYEAGLGDDQYAALLETDSADALRGWLGDFTGHLQELMQTQRSNTSKSFVEKAKDYVRENYSDDKLSVNQVCRELGVSAAYFSTVFKKETGQTFIAYLTDFRMQEAVRMMIEQDEKTYIIAEKVGYADPNYFSYVFKKQFGVSPTKYKKQEKGADA